MPAEMGPCESFNGRPRDERRNVIEYTSLDHARAILAARRGGTVLPEGLLELSGAEDGARGVKFIDACADSHEAGGVWTSCWIDP